MMQDPCSQQLAAFVVLADFLLTFKRILFEILRKILIWPYTCLFLHLLKSTNQITSMYKCPVWEVYSKPLLYGWVQPSLFDFWFLIFFFFSFGSESTVPSTYMFLLVIPIALLGFQRATGTLCMWITHSMNLAWMLCLTFHPLWK